MSGRRPCGWYEDGQECGKPSVDHMGDWYLCAEHHDQLIREAENIPEADVDEEWAAAQLEDDDELQGGD
jgi:hypothetical protein